MKNTVKKILAIVTAGCLMLSVAACGEKKEETPKNTSTAAATTTASGEAKAEPVTLKVYSEGSGWQFPDGIQKDPVALKIQEDTGITMDFMRHVNEKLNVLLASGDLPDVMELSNKALIGQMLKANQIIELDALIDSNGKDIKQNIPKALDYSRKYLTTTGKLYALPNDIGEKLPWPTSAPWLRWDYYKELGYPEIKNSNDLLDVVGKMLKAHPTNEDGKNFVGFSPWLGDWNLQMYFNTMAYESASYAIEFGLGQYNYLDDKFTSMLYDDNSALWQGIRFWNAAKRRGLLDPNALTQKYDQGSQKAGSNQVLCATASWVVDAASKDLDKKGFADRGFMPVAPFTESKGVWAATAQPVGGIRIWVITSSCKTPERAMDFLNWIYSIEGTATLYNGIKGDTWEDANGEFKLTDKGLKAINEANYYETYGIAKYVNMVGLANIYNGKPMQLTELEEVKKMSQNALQKDCNEHYGAYGPAAQIVKAKPDAYMNTNIFNLFMPADHPEEMKRINAQCTNIGNQAAAKLVLAKDDAEFDKLKKKFIEDMNAAGYDKLFDYINKAYEEAHKIAADFK